MTKRQKQTFIVKTFMLLFREEIKRIFYAKNFFSLFRTLEILFQKPCFCDVNTGP